MHKPNYWKTVLLPHHVFWAEVALSLFFSIIIFSPLVSAGDVVRFQNRSVLVNKSEPGVVATYTFNLQYTTQTSIGSFDMLFCNDPIPNDPCYAPDGIDVSKAVLTSQTGETGYTISSRSANHLILTRNPSVAGTELSTYVFTGILNPTDLTRAYSVRLSDYASTDAVGPVIDLGSVIAVVDNPIFIYTQVPPLLIFCLGQQVTDTCDNVNGGNYSDMGDLNPQNTVTAESQMAVATNASQGYTITVNGTTLAAGSHVINAIGSPGVSVPGTNQFGMNLVANTTPIVGSNTDGNYSNGVAAPAYAQPNMYTFHDGDIVAAAPNVSLGQRYTVSYVVNSSASLPAGVYSTTLTYICSGRF